MGEFSESPTRNNLLRLNAEETPGLPDVLAEAGDTEMDADGRHRRRRLRKQRGQGYYADLLFALAHKRIDPLAARSIWTAIMRHKRLLTQTLGRSPGVAVAAHDYLVNVGGLMQDVVLVERDRLSRIASAATHDGLTGLYDHASLHVALHRELARARRDGSRVSVLMLDIDHFKHFNDSHGHVAGDQVLRRVADIASQCVREMDLVARYGGEELCVVAPAASEMDAQHMAERIRESIEAAGDVTVSVGVASSRGELGSSELIDLADRALYTAKRAGRNRVSVA